MHPNPWLCFSGSVNHDSKQCNLPLEKYTFFNNMKTVTDYLYHVSLSSPF